MHLPDTRLSDRLFLTLAFLATAFALLMHVGIVRTTITRGEWKVAADFVRSQIRKGDTIVVVPHWALMGAEALRGLPLLYVEDVTKEDLSKYRRLWVILAPRLGKWWFRRLYIREQREMAQSYWQKEHHTFGKVEVFLYQLPVIPPPRFDFSAKASLRQADVGIEIPPQEKRPRTCREGGPSGEIRWLRSWQDTPGMFRDGQTSFGRVLQEIQDTRRFMLWAQPLRCKILRVHYRNVPLQGTFRLSHGFGTPAPRSFLPGIKPSGEDVEISVLIEGRMLKTYRLSQKEGYREHRFDLESSEPRSAFGSVTFLIQTIGLASDRPGYSFHAQIDPFELQPPASARPSGPSPFKPR